MKLFRELSTEQQEKVLDKHDIGPLFYKQREAMKDMLMSSTVYYFDSNLKMHIHYKD